MFDLPRLHLFGDSHTIAYDGSPNVLVRYLADLTMNRVGRDGVSVFDLSGWDIREDDHLGFVLGEIDVRVHVGKQRDERGRAPEEILDTLAERYFKTLENVQALHPKSLISIFSTVPPAGADYPSFDSRYPRNGTDEERVAWTRGLNRRLEVEAKSHGYLYIDQYSVFSNEQGLLDLTVSDDGVHIRPGLLAKVDIERTFGPKPSI